MNIKNLKSFISDFRAGSKEGTGKGGFFSKKDNRSELNNLFNSTEISIFKSDCGLYQEGFKLAQDLIQDVLNKKALPKLRVEEYIAKLSGLFCKDPYHELLLHSYFNSEEDYLPAHLLNGAILSMAFTSKLGETEEKVKRIGLCGFYHDIGMAFFKELYSKPKSFSGGEKKQIQGHVEKSRELLSSLLPADALKIIESVHLRRGGEGYPKSGESVLIPHEARMIALCDIYEALTHTRAYRKQYGKHEAICKLVEEAGSSFETRDIKSFIDFIAVYPVGSVNYLNTGEIGLVIRANGDSSLRPTLRVLVSPHNHELRNESVIDLVQNGLICIEGPIDPAAENALYTFPTFENNDSKS